MIILLLNLVPSTPLSLSPPPIQTTFNIYSN
jgi:hypothetical protein